MSFRFFKRLVETLLKDALNTLIQSKALAHDGDGVVIKIERSKNRDFGDFSTNLALILAKPCQKSPKELAELLVRQLPKHPRLKHIEIAGPGFINFFMQPEERFQVIRLILKGDQTCEEEGDMGHARSTVFGDFLEKSQSSDHLVYSIQYAHARICSVLHQLNEQAYDFNESIGLAHLHLLETPQEQALVLLLSRYPEVITLAEKACEPQLVAYYLRDLANGLHSYYNAIVLLCEQKTLRFARLCLLQAVRQVLANGLRLLGVSAPETM